MGKEKDTKRVPFAEWVSTFGKDYKNSITKASITPRYEKIPSNAIGITYAMCGGWPHGGRLYEIAGPNSTGKTTLAFRAIGDFLNAFSDKNVLFIDVEQSLDIEYQCRMNGIDSNRVYIWKPKVGMSGEQILGSILDMSMQIEGLVETSLNLGILELKEEHLFLVVSLRSSVGSRKDDLCDKVCQIIEMVGGECTIEGAYPAWEYKADSVCFHST